MPHEEWLQQLLEQASAIGALVRAVDDDTARAYEPSQEFTVVAVRFDPGIQGWWLARPGGSERTMVSLPRRRVNRAPVPGDRVRYWGLPAYPNGVALNDTVLWYDSTPWRTAQLKLAATKARSVAFPPRG